ncbi:hypothetical protein H2248_002345 [Termitomyces sp. 'cryptogamus']|nr:hypothetical protein H2248_002345 [Termitomyces sp. 'cryptogamus']
MPELFEYDTGVRFVRPRGLGWCGWGNNIFRAKVTIGEAFLVVAIVPANVQEIGESGKGGADDICKDENGKLVLGEKEGRGDDEPSTMVDEHKKAGLFMSG